MHNPSKNKTMVFNDVRFGSIPEPVAIVYKITYFARDTCRWIIPLERIAVISDKSVVTSVRLNIPYRPILPNKFRKLSYYNFILFEFCILE